MEPPLICVEQMACVRCIAAVQVLKPTGRRGRIAAKETCEGSSRRMDWPFAVNWQPDQLLDFYRIDFHAASEANSKASSAPYRHHGRAIESMVRPSLTPS